jgi:hypothetical protein
MMLNQSYRANKLVINNIFQKSLRMFSFDYNAIEEP